MDSDENIISLFQGVAKPPRKEVAVEKVSKKFEQPKHQQRSRLRQYKELEYGTTLLNKTIVVIDNTAFERHES